MSCKYLAHLRRTKFEGIRIPPPEIRSYRDYDLDECRAIARDYTTRTGWKDGDRQSYQAAYTFGWLDDCAKHMTRKHRRRPRNSS
jgi:hypothetical protein